jgi:hypothetical protein
LTVVVVLREELAAARRSGTPFEMAWPDAMRLAVACAPLAWEQGDWRVALRATRLDWADAYAGEDPRAIAVAAAAVAA